MARTISVAALQAAFGEDMFLALNSLNSPKTVSLLGKVNRQNDGEFDLALGKLVAQWGIPIPRDDKKLIKETNALFSNIFYFSYAYSKNGRNYFKGYYIARRELYLRALRCSPSITLSSRLIL